MSNKGSLIIGVDGGGTKTSTCCLSAESKKVLGVVKTESSNWNSVGNDKAKEALRDGIHGSIKEAHAEATQVAAICLSMAGVDRPEDKIKVSGWILEILPHLSKENIHVHSDAVAALASGTSGHLYGVVVISGTGMICYGFDKKGESKRSGGWGPLLGDEGSGFAIASDALRAVVCHSDGRGSFTSLTQKFLSHLKLTEASQLIPWAYSDKDHSWKRIAELAPIVYESAIEGDSISLDIIDNAAQKLSITIQAVVKRLEFPKPESNETFPLVFSGGNLTHHNSILAKKLSEKINKEIPNADIKYPSIDPEQAAALFALTQLK